MLNKSGNITYPSLDAFKYAWTFNSCSLFLLSDNHCNEFHNACDPETGNNNEQINKRFIQGDKERRAQEQNKLKFV